VIPVTDTTKVKFLQRLGGAMALPTAKKIWILGVSSNKSGETHAL